MHSAFRSSSSSDKSTEKKKNSQSSSQDSDSIPSLPSKRSKLSLSPSSASLSKPINTTNNNTRETLSNSPPSILPKASSSIPSFSSSNHLSSPSPASEHLRRVASSATLRVLSSSNTTSSTSTTPNRNRAVSRAPSVASSLKPHSLSLSPSSSALATTSQIHAQADSIATSPSNLSLTEPASTSTNWNPTSSSTTTNSTTDSTISSSSGGTIRRKPLNIENPDKGMKRKSDHQEVHPASTSSPSTSFTTPNQDREAATAASSHTRQRLASSTARPQTWFGRLGGGGSAIAPSASSSKTAGSEQEVLTKEEEDFRKSLGLGMSEKMDEGQTVRVNKRGESRNGNGQVASGSASIDVSSNQNSEEKDVVMKDSEGNGTDLERAQTDQESKSGTLRPSKPSSNPANRASWFWPRNASNETPPSQASDSKLSPQEAMEEPQISEPQPQPQLQPQPQSQDLQEGTNTQTSSSPILASAKTVTHEVKGPQLSQLDSLRQSATGYASPLRRLWGGGPTEEELGLPSERVKEETQSQGASETKSEAIDKASQEELAQPAPSQKGWFWTRRTPPDFNSNSESYPASLPPRDGTATQVQDPSFSTSSQSPQLESASYSANQGYSYSSYLASWIPTWRSENSSSDQAPGSSEDVQMHSEVQEESQTPAQKIRAEALARPEVRSESSSASSSALSPSASHAVLNSVTRKGWIAYFSSNSANKPRSVLPIEDAPEVMDLDEDEPNATGKTGNISGTLTPRSVISTSKESVASSVAAQIKSQAPRSSLDGVVSSKTKSGPKVKQSPNPPSKSNRPEVPKDPAPPKSRPVTPLTNDKAAASAIKKAAAANGDSNAGSGGKPPAARAPNLVLPTFEDTFFSPPRSLPPKAGVLTRTLAAVGSYLLSIPPDASRLRTAPRKRRTSSAAFSLGGSADEDSSIEVDAMEQQQRLPRAWGVIGEKEREAKRGCENVKKVVVIGVHGWFSQSIFKTVLGEPTGTSLKFATMMAASVRKHFKEADMELNPEAVTVIPLQGDGRVGDRVDRLFSELLNRKQWVEDIASADALFIAAHSQGAIVSTHLVARLIEQKHLNPKKTKVCLLAMCGIHHGPFNHLKSTVTTSFINYFETAAAKELFEFQSSNAQVSKHYVSSLNIALKAGVKFCYVASVDDQVVPLESALNSSSSHPSILRALYVDGQSFPRTDFLTNLLVFCVKVRNSGLGDHNLLTLLSSSVAGSLYSGLGHSLVYNEPLVYDLSTRYLLETSHPSSNPTTRSDEASPPELRTMSFEAQKWNPYSLPWALRGLLEDQDVRELFADDVRKLLSDYHQWNPTTKVLKDLQWRLEPMKMIKPSQSLGSPSASSSKAQDSGSNNNNSKL